MVVELTNLRIPAGCLWICGLEMIETMMFGAERALGMVPFQQQQMGFHMIQAAFNGSSWEHLQETLGFYQQTRFFASEKNPPSSWM